MYKVNFQALPSGNYRYLTTLLTCCSPGHSLLRNSWSVNYHCLLPKGSSNSIKKCSHFPRPSIWAPDECFGESKNWWRIHQRVWIAKEIANICFRLSPQINIKVECLSIIKLSACFFCLRVKQPAWHLTYIHLGLYSSM